MAKVQAEATAEETNSDAEGGESQANIERAIKSKLSGILALWKKLFDKASENIKGALQETP